MDIFLHNLNAVITTNKPNNIEEILEPRLEGEEREFGKQDVWCNGPKELENA